MAGLFFPSHCSLGAQWPLSDEKSVTVFVSENKEDLLEEKTTVTNNPETPDDKL